MPAKFNTVDAYVAVLPDGVQEIFAALRETILKLAPAAEEVIRYDMPAWRLNSTTVIHAAAWKSHIGLYPVYRGDADFEFAIGPFRDKKDTVKFPYKRPMPFELVERIVRVRLELDARP